MANSCLGSPCPGGELVEFCTNGLDGEKQISHLLQDQQLPQLQLLKKEALTKLIAYHIGSWQGLFGGEANI